MDRKKTARIAPQTGFFTDSHVEMEFPGAMHDPSTPIDPRAADEALARWDELPAPLLARLSTDPVHGPRLARLREAEAWLRAEGARARRTRLEAGVGPSLSACPGPEELYDLGRGPGHGPLELGRRAELERHLRVCLDCELLVETLASRPPVPLELAPLDEHEGAEEHFEREALARPRLAPAPAPLQRLRPLVPLVAAASLIVVLGIWSSRDGSGSALQLPQPPQLRGAAASDLLWPRGLVLAPPPGTERGPLADLLFEIEPVEGADEYRIELYQGDADASPFEPGSRIASHAGSQPSVPLAEVLAGPLEPGSYTWSGWARVDGLERRIGEHDFEVVHDPELWRALSDLAPDAAAERIADLVRRLHAGGYTADARALARRMPASVERDTYLDTRPGR